jgi:hypothetical protein
MELIRKNGPPVGVTPERFEWRSDRDEIVPADALWRPAVVTRPQRNRRGGSVTNRRRSREGPGVTCAE